RRKRTDRKRRGLGLPDPACAHRARDLVAGRQELAARTRHPVESQLEASQFRPPQRYRLLDLRFRVHVGRHGNLCGLAHALSETPSSPLPPSFPPAWPPKPPPPPLPSQSAQSEARTST